MKKLKILSLLMLIIFTTTNLAFAADYYVQDMWGIYTDQTNSSFLCHSYNDGSTELVADVNHNADILFTTLRLEGNLLPGDRVVVQFYKANAGDTVDSAISRGPVETKTYYGVSTNVNPSVDANIVRITLYTSDVKGLRTVFITYVTNSSGNTTHFNWMPSPDNVAYVTSSDISSIINQLSNLNTTITNQFNNVINKLNTITSDLSDIKTKLDEVKSKLDTANNTLNTMNNTLNNINNNVANLNNYITTPRNGTVNTPGMGDNSVDSSINDTFTNPTEQPYTYDRQDVNLIDKTDPSPDPLPGMPDPAQSIMPHDTPTQRDNPIQKDNPIQRDPVTKDNPIQRDPVTKDDPIQKDPVVKDNPLPRDPVVRDAPIQRDQPIQRDNPLSRDNPITPDPPLS